MHPALPGADETVDAENRAASVLDMSGLAQKGGAVISDIKITHVPFQGSNKISDGRADLYLGFDILNATDPKNLDKCHPSRTIAANCAI